MLYGLGEQRVALGAERSGLSAPVPASTSPKKGLPHEAYIYDSKFDAYRCPQGNRSQKKNYIKQSQGWQYKFHAKECNACPVRETCTTNENGRTVPPNFAGAGASIEEQ
ncbi:transposase [Paenibacillus daejeonensis]|uniref:transposase n=1 Tax=Paenibacillus daejeonensis TaxID=135193 RepID=UPI0009FE4999